MVIKQNDILIGAFHFLKNRSIDYFLAKLEFDVIDYYSLTL